MLTPRADRPEIKHLELYRTLIQKAFEHRRKTLRNNLSTLLSKDALAAIETETDISFTRRGETLSEAEFILLSDTAARYL